MTGFVENRQSVYLDWNLKMTLCGTFSKTISTSVNMHTSGSSFFLWCFFISLFCLTALPLAVQQQWLTWLQSPQTLQQIKQYFLPLKFVIILLNNWIINSIVQPFPSPSKALLYWLVQAPCFFIGYLEQDSVSCFKKDLTERTQCVQAEGCTSKTK